MLSSLQIENVAVIQKANVHFEKGLNVLTGETGAGKSILIDSINAILGNRTSKDLVRTGAAKAVIRAAFDDVPPAVLDSLEKAGYEVIVPEFECCGLPMVANGFFDDARAAASRNVDTLAALISSGDVPVLTVCPSCQLMLKQEYAEYFPELGKHESIVPHVQDACEFLIGLIESGELDIDELGLSLEELNDIDRVYVIACGTSYHAGLIAKNLIEGWARIPTEVEAASEFRYRNPIITPTTLVVAVSQSGETADTLAAIRDARIKGAKVFGITNVVGSPVARESDGVIYTKANKEIAVASTKSFIGQVVSLTLLALLLAQVKYRLTTKQARMLFRELSDTAEQIQWILDTQTEAVHEAALVCKDAQSALFVGRGMGAAISYEGALKLKEVSYLHAEAYAAGEMKHGPIALIDPGFPVIAVATKSATYDKTVSNLMECKARGAKVIVVATEGDEEINKILDPHSMV